ncbi:uncharacterized protein LOC131552027 isoform X2 [Onychostoma macrolepis]|uniref:uncharacterized protein LOC131552027 isoform X2 n=1 Tax=Onychostoma macrolepis TaxID=369639 RepID=UPI00272B7D8F|nr:uncharacterized protein LOC131552027 isoform X2 [Onychostoma macrolepis]
MCLGERHPAAAPQTHFLLDTSGWTPVDGQQTSFPYHHSLFKFDAPCRCQRHARKFAHWTDMAKAVVMGKLQPVFRIPRKRKLEQVMQEHAYTKKAEKHRKLETRPESLMPKSVLEEVCLEVILSDGDAAYLTLSLTCTALRDVVSSLEFRHRAHYAWLESVVNVKKLPQAVRDMCVPFKIVQCRKNAVYPLVKTEHKYAVYQ